MWHVWQTPLWSVHPTGCKRPAGSANSSWHYLLLILIPCAGILWHPWERWTCTRRGRLGRREQGEGRWGARRRLPPGTPRSFLQFPHPCMGCGDAFPACPLPSVWQQASPIWWMDKPKASCTLSALVRQVFQNHLPRPLPRLLCRSRAFSPVTGFPTNSFLFIITIAWPLWTRCITPV